jgi:hypothetical protein
MLNSANEPSGQERFFSRFWGNGYFKNVQILTKIILEWLKTCFLVKSLATGAGSSK